MSECKKQYLKEGKFNYLRCGQGKPILFFHGYGISPLSFDKIIRILAEKYLVIAPYLYNSWDPDKQQQFIDQLGIKDKLTIIGYSMGALVAVKFVLNNPEKVANLIIIDGLLLPLKKNLFQAVKDVLSDRTIRLSSPIDRRDTLTMIKDSVNNLIHYPITLIRWTKYCLNVDLSDKIKDIKTKTLIIWGKNDRIIPMEQGVKLNTLINNSSLIVKPGGHTIIFEYPQVISEEINIFINAN